MIVVRVEETIFSSVDAVRAQYLDFEHHIRHDVHPAFEYSVVEGGPEPVVKCRTRSNGAEDVFRVSRSQDHAHVLDYVEGPHRGTRLEHRFSPRGKEETQVEVVGYFQSNLVRLLVRPVFVWIARWQLQRALLEDKRDLEVGAYRQRPK